MVSVLAFSVALFSSATLLFLVQPMVAKMLLPLLGGAPAVWNTSMVFFQAVLLAGYAYAHVALRALGVRRQALAHLVVLALPMLVLPIVIDEHAIAGWSREGDPTLPLLGLLLVRVGPAFFVLSTSAPLVQRWFSRLGHPHGNDPYFLYGASNLGSMLSLAAYPAILEPLLGVRGQSRVWRIGYVAFMVLVGACALVTARYAKDERPAAPPAEGAPAPAAAPAPAPAPIDAARRARWVLLSFLPSSLLLGVTTYVTTDVAAVPLLWVVPLAAYLLTFILVFARRPPIPHALVLRALPLLATGVATLVVGEVPGPLWLLLGLHLGLFFVVSMTCHGELARDRPDAKHLTEFFLWLSVGGVLGGIVNGMLAPIVFDRILEYPLAIVGACLARPSTDDAPADPKRARIADVAVVAAMALFMFVALRATRQLPFVAVFGVAFAAPLVVNFVGRARRLRFAAGLGVILLAGGYRAGLFGKTIFVARDFFGVVRVTHDDQGRFAQIVHGQTVHGRQHLAPGRALDCTGYHHPTGPVGDVMKSFEAPDHRVAVVGLGAGVLGCYAKAGQAWTFYEISPLVVRVAKDPRFFSFLSGAFPDPSRVKIELGDGRLRLLEAGPAAFDLIIMEAFSSDAIPIHLLTREAVSAYLERLAPGGVILWNTSNKYVALERPLGAIARDLGLAVLVRDDFDVPAALADDGKLATQFVVYAREARVLEPIATRTPAWRPPVAAERAWTDDYSNILSALKR
jgi:hypothetical protein